MRLLVNIDVPEVPAAERFYTAAFGLSVGRRFGSDTLELLGAEVPIYLLQKPAGSIAVAEAGRDYARHWSPLHCDVVVDNLEAALVRAVDAGATQEGMIRPTSWGRIVQLADPFGHGWCLIQFSTAGYDAITT
ncbi:MAG: VOC family protein [Xanthomonadales bacterium]|nr:VOC family protein [Xanthomonadales bacterium]ODU95217.1 MAG: glyoxalase [Rhodanobacter sp. SCN 66-43]OJY82945.1 MAG: glyoxalase [Xanthomonadales bacterium 66-474]